MKINLDDIDKKQPYSIPEQYFEDLPLKIQGRISAESHSKLSWLPNFSLVWKLIIATVPIIILAIFIYLPPSNPTAEELLAEIPESELIAYVDQIDLNLSDISQTFENEIMNGLLEDHSLNDVEINTEQLQDILLEYDLEIEHVGS